MRILFDQVIYDLRNKGNVALTQVALRRVRNFWPEASLEVMTETAHILRLYCPEAFPVKVFEGKNWLENRGSLRGIQLLTPAPILRVLLEIREELHHRKITPRRIKQWIRNIAGRLREVQIPEMELDPEPRGFVHFDSRDVEQALEGADLVIGTGGGYLVDTDKYITTPVLKRLHMAKQKGKFVALVGQGVGPIEDPEFRAVAASVLPEVDLILVRESPFAIPMLESLGVPPDRILMSGDDAVELAYEARSSVLGDGIGISMRMASYTDVQGRDLQQIRLVLHKTAAKFGARLIGLPTSCCGIESDQFKIRELLDGYPKAFQSPFRFESVPELIRKVGECRVVVAGAFHAAVFALAQGIPAIGLVKSEEYAIKFHGLVDQFGAGCQYFYLNDERFEEKLTDAISTAWEMAEDLRPRLLQAASNQIQLNQMAYQRLHDLYQLQH